jgi:hypothetical protein
VAAALCCYLRTRMLVVIEVIPSHNESRSGDADLKREECVAQNPYVSNALWGASMRTRWDAACSHAQAIYLHRESSGSKLRFEAWKVWKVA